MHRKDIYLIILVILSSCHNDFEELKDNEWISTNREFWSEPGIYLDLRNSDSLCIARHFNFENISKHKYQIDSKHNLILDDTLLYGNITKHTSDILLIKDTVETKSFLAIKDYHLETDTNDLNSLLLSNEWQMNDELGSFRIEFKSEPWYINPSKLKKCIRINESKGWESYDYDWWAIKKHRNSYFIILSYWRQTDYQIYQIKSISDSLILTETCWSDSIESIKFAALKNLPKNDYQNLRNRLIGTWQLFDFAAISDSSTSLKIDEELISIKHTRTYRPFHENDSVPIILDTYFTDNEINYTFSKNGEGSMEQNNTNLRNASWTLSNDGKYIHTKDGWMNSMKIISLTDSILITEKHEVFEYPERNEWKDVYIRESLKKITVPNSK